MDNPRRYRFPAADGSTLTFARGSFPKAEEYYALSEEHSQCAVHICRVFPRPYMQERQMDVEGLVRKHVQPVGKTADING